MRLSPREQGDVGEFSAMLWLAEQGAKIYLPLGHSPDVDLIADFGDRLVRVQVKTCTYFRGERWCVMIATRGGNQSWSGVVKRFDPSRVDALFVLAGDGRRWYIPADRVEGTSGILLGGPKYAAFEVDQGAPISGVHAGPR
ncbi:MAG TPA: group I intron-associated PD-(D/E)XK endonuclease [Solirubrobacteraceae bacterium]|nr:group I intron-associated PD-(D/E)XK endonuclease [Solirubrobacteraceae bacterium]